MNKSETQSPPLFTDVSKNIRVHHHSLVEHKLTLMRDCDCSTNRFRTLTREISTFLAYQATQDLPIVLEDVEIIKNAPKIPKPMIEGKKAVIVPILRAGLVVADGALDAMPAAHVGHMAFQRQKKGHGVDVSMVVLPDPQDRLFLLCDAVIGTGHTACKAIEVLTALDVAEDNIRFITMLISPEGAARVAQEYPGVVVHAISQEDGLDGNGHVSPGFGDASDRLFGIR